jgi:1-acyl-sn-glycerol-3-phosphate acyltransferase
MIPFRARLALWGQRALGLACFPLMGSIMVAILRVRGLCVEDMAGVRRRFADLVREHRGPLLVCGNHITQIDTVLVDWALAANWRYFLRFRLLPWNLPERRNYYDNIALRIICYLSKCIPIVRDGTTAEKKESMARLRYLLQRGESVSIFPEGTRTRTGALDMENFGYGVGQLASQVKDALILCVYLRGHRQQQRSGLPHPGDTLHVELQALKPDTPHTGRRAARDIAVQIMHTLQEMEQRYFERHPSMRPITAVDAITDGTLAEQGAV